MIDDPTDQKPKASNTQSILDQYQNIYRIMMVCSSFPGLGILGWFAVTTAP